MRLYFDKIWLRFCATFACAALGQLAFSTPNAAAEIRIVPQVGPTNPSGGQFTVDGQHVLTWGNGSASYWTSTGELLEGYPCSGVAALSVKGDWACAEADGRVTLKGSDAKEATSIPSLRPRE